LSNMMIITIQVMKSFKEQVLENARYPCLPTPL